MNDIADKPKEIVAFWRGAGPRGWFKKDPALDAEIRRRFLSLHERAAAGGLADWERTAEGALALLLLLDQFPRNMFRGEARAFATDAAARAVAGRAIAKGFDITARGMQPDMQAFFYLPFEHSEAIADQERSVALFAKRGDAADLKWAQVHADIIRRFGRFPHRNAALGRAATPEEQEFLDAGGFAG